MALVAPPLSFFHRLHSPSLNIKTRSSCKRDHLNWIFRPKTSLSVCAETHYSDSLSLTNSPSHHISLLREVTDLCDSGNLTEALHVLQRNSNGASTDSVQRKDAIGVLLQACGLQKDIEVGRRVHEMVSGSSQICNDFVINNRLITMYSMCRSPLESRSVFDRLESKNLFQWNAIISGCCKNLLFDDVLRLFVELISVTELKPDNFTLPCVFKACGGILEVGFGEVVHGIAVKLGLIVDVFVGNALIAMYGKCGLIEEAVKVFDNMPERNLVSWNSMICGFSENELFQESFVWFKQMMVGAGDLMPDVATMVTMLPVCADIGDVEMGMLLHSLATKLRLPQEVMVNNALIDMYTKCGYICEARTLFERTNNKNVVSWNTMIGGFSAEGDIYETFDLLRKMQMVEEKMKANEVTILNALPVCLDESRLVSLKELHGYSFRNGLHCDELVANAFIAAYTKCGALSSAEHVFDGMVTKTVSSWNAFIGGYAQNDDPSKALEIYIQMAHSGVDPDLFSIGSLLVACARLKSFRYGKEIHALVLRKGSETDLFIINSLLSLYLHCGKSISARILFEAMDDKSLISWNTMISGYSQNGLPDDALLLFRQMLSEGIQPYEIAIVSVFGACSQLSTVRLGRETHCYAIKSFLMEDVYVDCSIVDMYAKCGYLQQSRRVFDRLRDKNVASWNSMIVGYGIHGHVKEAIGLYKEMQKFGRKPDGFTFIGILMACSHAGLVADGMECFNQMQNLHGLEPKLEHYACVVDMLGRAGKLVDALRLIDDMPEEPDARVWSSLLSSCNNYGDLSTGEKIAEKLLELEPDKAENYVLLSNLYARLDKWDDVRRVRQRMKEIGLYKDAGCSWIELGGKIYSFLVGDYLLPESEEIQDMWRRLEEKIKKIGYRPYTGSILHELAEEEKIEILRGHSEKLAISFGLLKTAKGTTLRVCKNLRICVDCHNAAKLISKVVQRNIVVRDNKRFHHFKDGLCSCRDYW